MALAVFCAPIMGITEPASAASGRVKAPAIGLNASIVKVGVKNGRLQIGHNLHVLYTKRGGDPLCDASGRTMFAGHAWRSGDGVADNFGKLKRGNIIRAAGCRYKVYKKEVWSDDRSIKPLTRSSGRDELVLYGCKADNYDYATVIFARRVGRSTPFP